MSINKTMPIGGGTKKIIYAMQTIKKIGIKRSQKALRAKNSCKACGLGMGGQHGGMTNEQDVFPSVCNKSIQAQSTDIQDAIPAEIFDNNIDDFKELSAYEIEHLGRLGHPILKAAESNKFKILDWDSAIQYTAEKFAKTHPERSFFYSSGRSSNEAGFVLQLMARLYGTNNVNNCSYYCHQATGVGMSSTIGTSTATVELADLDGCDLIFIIGANPASNHPRLLHKLAVCRARGGKVVVINPAKEPGLVRFALPKSPISLMKGGDEIASHYLQTRIGSDVALLNGIAKSVIENNHQSTTFIKKYTEGYSNYVDNIKNISWEEIEQQTGLNKINITEVASIYAKSKGTIFCWGMGITQHKNGSDNVEAIASLALLRGMVGEKHKGLLPLRGHSNIQGIGSIGVKPILMDEMVQRLQKNLNIKLPSIKESAGLDTLGCLNLAHEGNVDAAMILGGNLYQASPDSKWAKVSLDSVKFKVFLTTTLNLGHVHCTDSSETLILPVTARDEEPEPTTQESMFNYVRLSDGGIKRIADARSEVTIISELAHKILSIKNTSIGKDIRNKPHTFNFKKLKSHQTVREIIADCIPDLKKLKEIAETKKEFHIQNRILHSSQFSTTRGKCKFITNRLNIKENPDYPLRLMTVRSEGQFNSIIYEENDSYRNIDQRWAVLMNEHDIKTMHLKVGDKVDIESVHGTMLAVTLYSFDLPQGDVMAYYPEANCLVDKAHDGRSKTPAFKHVPIKITLSTNTF